MASRRRWSSASSSATSSDSLLSRLPPDAIPRPVLVLAGAGFFGGGGFGRAAAGDASASSCASDSPPAGEPGLGEETLQLLGVATGPGDAAARGLPACPLLCAKAAAAGDPKDFAGCGAAGLFAAGRPLGAGDPGELQNTFSLPAADSSAGEWLMVVLVREVVLKFQSWRRAEPIVAAQLTALLRTARLPAACTERIGAPHPAPPAPKHRASGPCAQKHRAEGGSGVAAARPVALPHKLWPACRFRAWRAAMDASSAKLVVLGDGGVGKSALVRVGGDQAAAQQPRASETKPRPS